MHDKICTAVDLMKFAHADFEFTAIEFDLWIRERTNNKYTVIEYQLAREAISVAKHYTDPEIWNMFNTKWEDSLNLHKLNYD
jgi:hypothetical protein